VPFGNEVGESCIEGQELKVFSCTSIQFWKAAPEAG